LGGEYCGSGSEKLEMGSVEVNDGRNPPCA
jgi:hypothetical protein